MLVLFQVLLVLEDVDSLFEGGGDARDRLITLLSDLCSMGEHLKLMVTSEQSLLRDTNARFRHGSEKVRCRFDGFVRAAQA